MRKGLLTLLVLLLLFLTPRALFANETLTADQLKILEEKHKLIEEMKGKSKEEKLRMMEEFKQRVFNQQTTSEKTTVNKEERLKTKLEGFKNQNKAQIAEKVSNNLNKINDNRVAAMTKHLERLQSVLDKLEARVLASESQGKDTGESASAIASAQAAIDAASAAVETQAGKDYTLVVGDETTVRADAQGKRTALMEDLLSVHKGILTAKDAVINAIRIAVNTIGKEDVENE